MPNKNDFCIFLFLIRLVFQAFFLVFLFHGKSNKQWRQRKDKWNRNSALTTTKKVYWESPQDKISLNSFSSKTLWWFSMNYNRFSSLFISNKRFWTFSFCSLQLCFSIKFSDCDEWRQRQQTTKKWLAFIYYIFRKNNICLDEKLKRKTSSYKQIFRGNKNRKLFSQPPTVLFFVLIRNELFSSFFFLLSWFLFSRLCDGFCICAFYVALHFTNSPWKMFDEKALISF